MLQEDLPDAHNTAMAQKREINTIGPGEVQREDKNIQGRLFPVYDFAQGVFASRLVYPVGYHLDIGTFDGFALLKESYGAREVHSIDIDPSKLDKARARPEVKKLIDDKRIFLYQMNAVDLTLPANTFDSATIVEVFGAGFEGSEDDVEKVFSGVARCLRPGGIVVFTIRSRTMQEMLAQVLTFDSKGVAIPRRTLNPILRTYFNEPEWYGQDMLPRTEGGVVIPSQWSNRSYVPRKIDETHEVPIFWVGVCQKPNVR